MRFLPIQQDTPRVNLTPLIDVVFLLLIFLMVSTSFVDSSTLNIELPQASKNDTQQAFLLELSVSRDGQYVVDGEVISVALLYPKLEALALSHIAQGVAPGGLAAKVHADGAASHAAVVKAMDGLSRAGFSSVGIATLYNGNTQQQK